MYLPLETQTSTRQDGVLEVPRDGRQRILVHHASERLQFLQCLGIVHLVHERDLLAEREIRPVNTLGRVAVIRVEEILEDCLLVVGVVSIWVRGVIIASLRAVGGADHTIIGRVMVLVVMQFVGHLVDVASIFIILERWCCRGSGEVGVGRSQLEGRKERAGLTGDGFGYI